MALPPLESLREKAEETIRRNRVPLKKAPDKVQRLRSFSFGRSYLLVQKIKTMICFTRGEASPFTFDHELSLCLSIGDTQKAVSLNHSNAVLVMNVTACTLDIYTHCHIRVEYEKERYAGIPVEATLRNDYQWLITFTKKDLRELS